jgi:hypothetical protein
MRILYPDLVYGGIAPRAAHATIVNREYMEMIRRAAPPRCSAQLENAIRTIDSILSAGRLSRPLKMFLGLGELRHDDDFTRYVDPRPFRRNSLNSRTFIECHQTYEFKDVLIDSSASGAQYCAFPTDISTMNTEGMIFNYTSLLSGRGTLCG